MQRLRVLALSLLLVLWASPSGAAQEEGLLLEDPAGDVELRLYDNAQPMVGDWGGVDLVGLKLEETPTHLRLHVGVAALPSCDADTCAEAGDTRTYLDHNGVGYMVQAGMNLQGFVYGALYEAQGTFSLRRISTLEVRLDEATATFTVEVPRQAMLDADGTPLRGGRQLTGIHSEAFSQVSFGGPDPSLDGNATEMLVTTDKMGQDAPAWFDLRLGGGHSAGGLALDSRLPFRASNGGAATLVFDMEVHNNGTHDRVLQVVPVGMPSTWTFAAPEPFELVVDARSHFQVVVETPFGHQHGGIDLFRVQVEAVDDAAVHAWTEVGVTYLAVPQPAGHHDLLWLHSRGVPEPFPLVNAALGGSTGQLRMNTVEEDADDERVPVQGYASGFPAADQLRWSVCLDPVLALGLDFDLAREGLAHIPLQSTKPLQGARLSGEVLVLGPGEQIRSCFPSSYRDRDQTVVAKIGPSDTFDLASRAVVEAKVAPLQDGDFVPYAEGQQLVLELALTWRTPLPNSAGSAEILPGAWVQLPLSEYHDARPAGIVGSAAGEPTDTNATAPPADDGKDRGAPGPVLLAPVLGMLGLALLRRRR